MADPVRVILERTTRRATDDQPLWVAIRNRTQAIGFPRFDEFVRRVFCDDNSATSPGGPVKKEKQECPDLSTTTLGLPDLNKTVLSRIGAYDVLKTAADVFLLLNCGLTIDDGLVYAQKPGGVQPFDPASEHGPLIKPNQEADRLGVDASTIDIAYLRSRLGDYVSVRKGAPVLPYLKRVLDAAFEGDSYITSPFCAGVLKRNVDPCTAPCFLELIWSYWMEEAMLVQALNAVTIRFQNRRSSDRDPLAHLEIDPLRPLNNIIWGYVQDEFNRLTVVRRAYEYDHHYGLTLYGRAVPALRTADSRSRFLEAFHHLLYGASQFLKADDDTTIIADAFPVLQPLKELHLLLAQGAHNQYGDLPWTARAEMLIQQWLMARPEMRDFLQGRAMVPYTEDWMPQVDTMKRLQGWTDTTVTHFRDLAVFGEQLLLSVRFGDWIEVNDAQQAANWARYWRPEIQSYIHAYRAATGVDLTTEALDGAVGHRTMPAALLKQRLAEQTATRR